MRALMHDAPNFADITLKVTMTDPIADAAPFPAALPSQTYRSAAVVGKKPLHFTYSADATARAQIAAHLGLAELPKLVLKGAFTPQGRGDVLLRAALTADVVQACIVTLAPVPTRLEQSVARDYLRDYAEDLTTEAELGPEDQEPIPEMFDVAAIAIEELTLALPLYPRAPGAELAPLTVTPPGAAPLTDAALRPFAGLASLAQAMKASQSE